MLVDISLIQKSIFLHFCKQIRPTVVKEPYGKVFIDRKVQEDKKKQLRVENFDWIVATACYLKLSLMMKRWVDLLLESNGIQAIQWSCVVPTSLPYVYCLHKRIGSLCLPLTEFVDTLLKFLRLTSNEEDQIVFLFLWDNLKL